MGYAGTSMSTVNADIVQTDVDAIIQGVTGSGGMTLSDVQDRLNLGLFDFGMMPWMEMLRYDIEYYLYNSAWGWEPWLQTVDRSINDGFYYHLYDQNAWQPWMQTVHSDLYSPWSMMPWLEMIRDDNEYYLHNVNGEWGTEPWMKTLHRTINDNFFDHLYDPNFGQPWPQTIHNDLFSPWSMMPWLETTNYDLNFYLYDQNTWQPWFQTIHNDLYSQWSLMPWLEMTYNDLNTYFYNQWNMQPWMETLTFTVYDGFNSFLNNWNAGEPWMQTISSGLDSYLYDWMNGRPLLESVRDELSAVRAVLEDVHDSAQHALRTV